MPMRTFSLNSREFYEAMTPPRDPNIWAGGLPRDPVRQHPSGGPCVRADSEAEAGEAFAAWLGHVEAGRIGANRIDNAE